MNQKKIVEIRKAGAKHWVGNGFPSRGVLQPGVGPNLMDPFILLDAVDPYEFPAGKEYRGVGEHPHRGFETVTIIYQGRAEHRDSSGGKGQIGPGDVQWMTAGSGLVHEEYHAPEFVRSGGVLESAQLWVNLPKRHKMTKPNYQEISAKEIPFVTVGKNSKARIIAGEFQGVRGPGNTFSPILLADFYLTAGEKINLALTEAWSCGLSFNKGAGWLQGQKYQATDFVICSWEGSDLEIESEQETHFLLMAGQPLQEPLFQYGPFVMNSREELIQAVEDYNSGKMGHLD